MDELASSNDLLADLPQLRAKLGQDGYLLFRGLLDGRDVAAARRAVARELIQAGWVGTEGNVQAAGKAPDANEKHPVFRAAARTADFNRLPYVKELRALVRDLLDGDAYSLPSKVLRATPPATSRTEYGRYVHQDFTYWRINDMLTTWIPLMDIPRSVGGLALRPGSQLGPPAALQLLDPTEPGWATTDYLAGDVLVFHCLTSHAAMPNRTETMRFSGDFRWQRRGEPVATELLFGADTQATSELFTREFADEPWWEPVPEGLTVIPHGTDHRPRARSRFFPVDARWNDPAVWND